VIIVHRCTECRHPDVWGKRDPHPVLGLAGGLPTNCGQGCHPRCSWNPQPETMPRHNQTGQPVAEVLPPGSQARWVTAEATHDCPACRQLYDQLTEGART
jgi:hypothetical protein